MRAWLAIVIGKISAFVSRLLRIGGGSSLPGVLALRIEPRILFRLLEKSTLTSIIITGSNGKTTTSRMIAEVLEHSGVHIVWNRSGANMVSGIVSALIQGCDTWGRLMADAAVFEVDEANLRHAMGAIRPTIVVVTNCFRDQLDRYGEVDTTLELIRTALKDLPVESTLILNADDPLVASLASSTQCRVLFYGIEEAFPSEGGFSDSEHNLSGTLKTSKYRPQDARNCAACGTYYEYSSITYGHLGKYRCPRCGLSRPFPHFRALDIIPKGFEGSEFTMIYETPILPVTASPTIERCQVSGPHGSESDSFSVSVGLPGLYNVYNCLAAVACCLTLGISSETIKEGIAKCPGAFGRMETIMVGDKKILLTLVKNPVGFTEVIRTICSERVDKTLLICLNDNFADGRDVSWIWDADIELIAENPGLVHTVIASGLRAWDMALRLKYAGISEEKICVEHDLDKALEMGLGQVGPGETLYILPTYTALLEIRENIRGRSHAREFWRA